MNIILANAAVNNGNRGCVALAISSLFILDRLLGERNMPHTFYLPQSGFPCKEKHSYKEGNIQVDFFP